MGIERAAVLGIEHGESDPLDGAATGPQGLATLRLRLAGFAMRAQEMFDRLGVSGSQGKSAVARSHQLLGRCCQLLARDQGPAAAAVGTTATRARRGYRRGGLSAKAPWGAGSSGHGLALENHSVRWMRRRGLVAEVRQ